MKGSRKSVSALTGILLLCMFSFISCSDSSINSPSNQDDGSLSKAIIGTWNSDGYKVTYFADGTFIDSSSFVGTESWKTYEITRGSYKINDRILYHYNTDYLYLEDNISSPIGETVTGLEITISNNKLSFKPVDIFTSNGKNNSISGIWSTQSWLTTCNSEPAYRGYLQRIYQIDNSNSTFRRQIIFLDNPNLKTITDVDLYDYKYPFLKLVINNFLQTVKVEFKNGLMYWWYNYDENHYWNKE
jgi:hypothetical protein